MISIFKLDVVRVMSFGIVGVDGKAGLGPGFFDDHQVRVRRDVTIDGVNDVDDGVRADLESEESRFEDQKHAVGLWLDREDGVDGYPLGP